MPLLVQIRNPRTSKAIKIKRLVIKTLYINSDSEINILSLSLWKFYKNSFLLFKYIVFLK